MGVVARQSIKSVLVTIAGITLGGLVTILSFHYFSKSEYGFTQNLLNIGGSAALFSLMGFSSGILIRGQKYPKGHPARSTFLTISVVIPLAFTICISILFFLFKNQFIGLYQEQDAAQIEEYFILFPIITFILVAFVWLEGYMQSLDKTAVQAFARELLFRVFYISLILLFGFRIIDYKQFIWSLSLAYIIPVMYLVWVAKKHGGFQFKYKKGHISKAEIKELTSFSAYHMLTQLSMVLLFQLSMLLLAPLAIDGLESVAVFTVASYVIGVLRSPTRILGVAVTPTFSRIYLEGKMKELGELFRRSTINLQLIGLASFALVYLNIDTIQTLTSYIQSGYGAIKGLIIILMIGQLADMLFGFNYELIGISKYYKYNFWLAIGILVIVFLLNYYLIIQYGVEGAAWATTLGIIIYNFMKAWFLWTKYKIQPFSYKSLQLILISIFCFFLVWWIPLIINIYFDLIIRSTIFVSIFTFFCIKFKISEELHQFLSKLLKERRPY